jgi:hypothetical protein
MRLVRPTSAGIGLAIENLRRSQMVAALSVVLVGVVGILFVRRRGSRKRAEVAPAR